MKKLALFAFQGEPTCFIHVLLNALDLKEKGHEVSIVLEGAATGLVPEIARQGHPLNSLYRKAKDLNLIDGACKACSVKMQAQQAIEAEGLRFLHDMSGHPGMGDYLARGYDIITF